MSYLAKVAEVNEDSSVYVLQCSTAMENVLFDNDWVSRSPDHFTYYTTCPRWRLDYHSATLAYPYALAGYEAYITPECATGNRFVINTQVDHARYGSEPHSRPKGSQDHAFRLALIDEAYVNAVRPGGFVRVSFRSYTVSFPATARPGVSHAAKFTVANEVENFDVPESLEFREFYRFLPDVSTRIGTGSVYEFEVTSLSADTQFNISPLELVIDMPINLGCYKASPTFDMSSPNILPDLTPAKYDLS